MFVSNVDVLHNTYKCNKTTAKYIMKHYEIPVLSIDKNGDYYFAKTKELEMILESLPIWIRWLN